VLLNLLPVIVTDVPAAPVEGAKAVMTGLLSTPTVTVNTWPEVATFPLTPTVTFPVVAPTGTTTESSVDEAVVTVADLLLNATLFKEAVGSKFFPVMVTVAPSGPDNGLKEVITGSVFSVGSSSLPHEAKNRQDPRWIANSNFLVTILIKRFKCRLSIMVSEKYLLGWNRRWQFHSKKKYPERMDHDNDFFKGHQEIGQKYLLLNSEKSLVNSKNYMG
jgi:hypothetical protein